MDAQSYDWGMHNTPNTPSPVVPAVTESLIFDVVKRTGLDFGVVSNVLFAARTAIVEVAPA